ncbi:hypothetical protein KY290_005394 [Solanum tuberosum]|uniref:Uncharacterized protein n=1 Tax=Solanum tuberosum TaxID=4113 RepID=A0ABQ7WGH5_SOLTU|nr:hypothetical protein KY289_005790 [Solanum tuberosum]KAH0778967.1 hypothetical protein KY290_005394 [Solanum tuberosum]
MKFNLYESLVGFSKTRCYMIHYFFSTHVESSSVSPLLTTFEDLSSSVSPLLTTFEDLSSSFKRFKPGFVYERRQPTFYHPETDPPPETAPQL